VSDNYQGAYDVVSLMLDSGYSNIAYLTDNPVYPSPRCDRFSGYQQALEARRLFFREKVVIVDDYGELGIGVVKSALVG
jgi:DNA-binding LacI/PurR family transcriptional regulator